MRSDHDATDANRADTPTTSRSRRPPVTGPAHDGRPASRHRRDHHGRQRPLGRPSRGAARRRRAIAPARARCGAPSRRAIDLGIRTLCVYAFSTENWSRPADEVAELMVIFSETIERELPDLAEQGVRTRFMGRRDRIPDDLVGADGGARARDRRTSTTLDLWIAFDYGGRAELVEAARRLVEDGVAGGGRRRGGARGAARGARAPRRRPADPDLRRAPALELPALAGELRRARLHRGALARLRRGRAARRGRRVRAARAEVRRR